MEEATEKVEERFKIPEMDIENPDVHLEVAYVSDGSRQKGPCGPEVVPLGHHVEPEVQPSCLVPG